MKQEESKKRLFNVFIMFILVTLLLCIATCGTILSDETQTDVSEIAEEQKSVIDEPAIVKTTIGENTISTPNIKEKEKEEIIIKKISLSPYKDLIDNLTDNEKYLIYQITYAEANNQSIEGQRAVIEVILNRVLSDKFPNTVEEVLSQPRQFSTWRVRDYVQHNENQELALELVSSQTPILSQDYVIFSGTKFNWGKNYIQIEDHWFGAL